MYDGYVYHSSEAAAVVVAGLSLSQTMAVRHLDLGMRYSYSYS